ncbi:MAG: HAMP domain-containing histidine kinase [Myxococcaceae bacterium]|nr:HAMP domain-containing histidine kinase [Myxococcaceae bacterium]
MSSLGQLLLDHTDELVHRWYERWRREGPTSPDLSEAALKKSLPGQLRVIGEAMLERNASPETPRELWELQERLDPEKRVREELPIEEVVREYAYVLEVVRSWLEERSEEVSFKELSFFYLAVFELAAESTRRYARYQAEQLARERAAYLAGIAHQMRTPLSTLKLYVQQRERGMAADAQALERLQRTVSRLGRLVEGVLRLERFRPEELPVHPEPVYPARLIDQLVADYAHDAVRKGLRLDVLANHSTSMQVDPDLLVDALGNLIQNAIKYTERGFVRVSMEEQPDAVVFRVEDSGPGISPERQRELFKTVQPGQQGGVGLGLNIAHRATTAQGGTLECQSEVGGGSTFVLRLPRMVEVREQASVAGEGSNRSD